MSDLINVTEQYHLPDYFVIDKSIKLLEQIDYIDKEQYKYTNTQLLYRFLGKLKSNCFVCDKQNSFNDVVDNFIFENIIIMYSNGTLFRCNINNQHLIEEKNLTNIAYICSFDNLYVNYEIYEQEQTPDIKTSIITGYDYHSYIKYKVFNESYYNTTDYKNFKRIQKLKELND